MSRSAATTVEQARPSERRQMDRGSLALLGLGHLFDDINQGALPAMLPFFIMAHNLSYTAAAGLMLALTVSSSILQPLLGEFSDRHSAPWLVPAGLLVAGTGIALSGLMPDYFLIALCIGTAGVGVAAFHPEAARFANYASGEQRATGMSIFSLGGNLGFALGPLLGSLVMATLGLGSSWVLAIPPAIMALAIAVQLPRFHRHRAASAREASTSRVVRKDRWGPFLRLTGAIVSRSILFYGLNTFVPLYWRDDFRESAAAGGIALSIMFTCGAIGTLAGGWLADRYGRLRVVLTSLIVLAVSIFIFTRISDPVLATVFLVPVGLALNAPSSVMVVMGQEYLPNRIGTASGVTLGLAVSVGGLLAPLLGGIADSYGIHTALTLLVAVPLVAFAFTATLPAAAERGVRV